MRIQRETEYAHNIDKTAHTYTGVSADRAEKAGAAVFDVSGTAFDNAVYDTRGHGAEEVARAAETEDVALMRDYLTVMSHSMSEEDFARLQREGYNPTDTDIETVVTIVDKIKAELARAGVDVAGYTDTLDMDTLAAAAGSESFARAIARALREADVPVTKQNVADTAAAAGKAEELRAPSDGTLAYMAAQHMEPTADNFYRAEYSGADGGRPRPGGYYREELPGYLAKQGDVREDAIPPGQLEKVIVRAGYEVTEETVRDARFLVRCGVPLTEESFSCLEKAKAAGVPVDRETFLKAAAAALADGKEAGEANLSDGRSRYEKAVCLDGEIDRLLEEAKASGQVPRRRQLEEIRLMMTVEANVKLLKSGFSIDTSGLEQLVEALRELEQGEAARLFGPGDGAPEAYGLYRETLSKTGELPRLPAAVAGRIAQEGVGNATVNRACEQGAALRSAYEQAGERYETLMTFPRKDMGDNIKEAFRNVDAILADLGIKDTEGNRRAVRILGYNGMEITPENIAAVKKADWTLRRVAEKMTPPAVVRMIRDGVNPLETGLERLEQYLDGQETYDGEALKYGRYLYNLEQNHEIKPEEREAYIGVYRLLRQIEKTDGAAVGSLVESGAEISFANLLGAVRTAKTRGMDVAVDDSFGALERLNARGISVTEQIAMGYTSGLADAWSRELEEKGHDARLLEEMRSLRQTEDGVLRLLKQYDMPATADNLLALSQLQKDRGGGFRKLWERRGKIEKMPEALARIDGWEDILEDGAAAGEAYGAYAEELMAAVREQTFDAAGDSLDVRELQLAHKQLGFMRRAAAGEEYDIPVIIDGEMTAVHLTLRHDSLRKGRVSVSLQGAPCGGMSAVLEVDGDSVDGYLTGETDEARELLARMERSFARALAGEGLKAGHIPAVRGRAVPGEETGREEAALERAGAGEKTETARLYRVARQFIKAMKQTLRETQTMVEER